MAETNEKLVTMPVLALRGLVLFPDMTLHFDVGRAASIAAIKFALSNNEKIFIVTQRDIAEEEPMFTGLYTVGVIAEVKQVLRVTEGGKTLRVVVEGLHRAVLTDLLSRRPFYRGIVTEREDTVVPAESADYETALIRNVRELFLNYCDISSKMSQDIVADVIGETDSSKFADKIAANVFMPVEEKQHLLTEMNPLHRLEYLSVTLAQEIELLMLEDEIHARVQEQMDKSQHDYYLREQLKAIYEELGEGEDAPEEADRYMAQIKESRMPEESKEKLYNECRRLAKMSSGSPDANVVRTYLDKCLALPWGIYTNESIKIPNARKILDKDHYGLKDVKERIIEMLAARCFSPDIKGQIICLAGPPGVGKTSIARSVAKAVGRNYVRISLGGVRDEAEIRGHRRTYIGAIPGRIINAVIDAKSQNPLILLDEIDKLSGDFKGDPASALLEVLDGEQNNTFCDHFIELPFDLSKVLFITTANDKYSIPEPLRDRMEIIDLASYTHEEKFNIAKKHLIPKQLGEHNFDKKQLKMNDKAIRLMIDGYTKEAGVRQLERLVAKVMRKSAVRFLESETQTITVTEKNLDEFLGPVKFRPDEVSHKDEVGLVNGLAWTAVGGEMLTIEVSVLEGTGKLELTGSLGDVMKESAKTAVSLVRSRAEQYGIDKDFYKTKDIHIHVPEGAVPKDGPSAGITMTTAITSALSNITVKGNVAMTGEITLRGRVLPIGGLKEKSMAAYRQGMTKVIIPWDNASDIEEIDDVVKEKITFIPVKTIDEVFAVALKNETKAEKHVVIPEKQQKTRTGVYN
ncbi:MAG: endopeptidase La [Clostridia bacterium]|nr:endopeptidase La [Clostridia bacterium]